MEGIGSRFGRVSSRYGSLPGPGPSATVFNGPVRKWKRRWVRSQPNDISVTGKGSHHHHQENKPTLLLCRWTRLPSTGNSDDPPEPTKRKFRYTPVVVLEEKKKEAVTNINAEAEAMEMKESRPPTTKDDVFVDTPDDDDFTEEMKEPTEDQECFENLDLQL